LEEPAVSIFRVAEMSSTEKSFVIKEGCVELELSILMGAHALKWGK
jgi:hypothetical protein